MSVVRPLGDADVLKKKTPQNPKYSHVESGLDTGSSASKVRKAKEMEDDCARYRREEHFQRIKPRKLFALLTDPNPALRLLIVDVRDDLAEFEACHLHTAVHYNPARLNHATNPWIAEILSARNKADTLIVLYDYDEVRSPDVANLMFEKGIDNVAVLHGGLKNYCAYHDNVEGVPPAGTPMLTKVDTASTYAPSIVSGMRSARSAMGSAAGSAAGSGRVWR